MTPYRIATLVFIHNHKEEQLLLRREKSPNLGLWTPIGGKLEIETGESPVECAIREAKEEADVELTHDDLHLFGYLAESNYEGQGHWLIFLFNCRKPVETLPIPIIEGTFGFHPLKSIPSLPIPASDHDVIWPIFRDNREGFTGIRIHYLPPESDTPYKVTIEQQLRVPNRKNTNQ